jgi:hypothetical protein
MALTTSGSAVTFSGVTIAAVFTFSFTNQRETIDVSEIGIVSKSFIAGSTTATANLEIFYDQGNASHLTLEAFIASGTAASLVITSATAQTYTASAILTSFEITGSAGDVIRASCSFQITGAVTIA